MEFNVKPPLNCEAVEKKSFPDLQIMLVFIVGSQMSLADAGKMLPFWLHCAYYYDGGADVSGLSQRFESGTSNVKETQMTQDTKQDRVTFKDFRVSYLLE